MMRTLKRTALAAAFGLAGTFSASAGILDFTDLSTFGAGSTATQAVGTFQGVGWTLTPTTRRLSYNFGDAAPAPFQLDDNGFDGNNKPVSPLLLDGDGIGSFDRVSDDENQVGRGEALILTFAKSIYFQKGFGLDLYRLNAQDQTPEQMFVYDYTGGVQGALLATATGTDFTVPNIIGGYAETESVRFRTASLLFVPGANRDDNTGDFALAGIEAEIPLPAAGVMLITALGGLGVARKLRRKA